jgi:hypothetical protein
MTQVTTGTMVGLPFPKPCLIWAADTIYPSLVDRVRRTSLKLANALKSDSHAASEGFSDPDMLLVELVALFHDMADGNYPFTVVCDSPVLQIS